MFRIFWFWLFAIIPLCADPPNLVETSPDGTWTSNAQWFSQGRGGYNWSLKNEKTGKVFFEEKVGPDDILPQSITVLWSPGGRYAALTEYYGRAMENVMVIQLTDHPAQIDPLPDTAKTPLEKTLLRPEDAAQFTGCNRLLTRGDHWINETDLSIGVDMLGYLKDRAAGLDINLATSWHKTIRLSGVTPKLIESVCDSYDKRLVNGP